MGTFPAVHMHCFCATSFCVADIGMFISKMLLSCCQHAHGPHARGGLSVQLMDNLDFPQAARELKQAADLLRSDGAQKVRLCTVTSQLTLCFQLEAAE